MSDKNQTSSKHQKLSGEKKKKKSGWISRNSSTRDRPKKDNGVVYKRGQTYEEYLASLEETPEE
jgi:hypothetical protein